MFGTEHNLSVYEQLFKNYSYLKLLTGFAIAALIDW